MKLSLRELLLVGACGSGKKKSKKRAGEKAQTANANLFRVNVPESRTKKKGGRRPGKEKSKGARFTFKLSSRKTKKSGGTKERRESIRQMLPFFKNLHMPPVSKENEVQESRCKMEKALLHKGVGKSGRKNDGQKREPTR